MKTLDQARTIEFSEAKELLMKLVHNIQDVQHNYEEVKAPFLMTLPSKPYTLVLDLDETLIHHDEEAHNR